LTFAVRGRSLTRASYLIRDSSNNIGIAFRSFVNTEESDLIQLSSRAVFRFILESNFAFHIPARPAFLLLPLYSGSYFPFEQSAPARTPFFLLNASHLNSSHQPRRKNEEASCVHNLHRFLRRDVPFNSQSCPKPEQGG